MRTSPDVTLTPTVTTSAAPDTASATARVSRVTWQRGGCVLHVRRGSPVASHVSALSPFVSMMIPLMHRRAFLPDTFAFGPGPLLGNIVCGPKLVLFQPMAQLNGLFHNIFKDFFWRFRVRHGALLYVTNLLLIIFKLLL